SRVVLVLIVLAGVARADELPSYVTVPAKPDREVVVENYGHTQIKVNRGGDGEDVVVAGKHWVTELDTSQLPGDERAKRTAIVQALEKGGWKRELARQEWNPPYASMKLTKNGKESWLFMWIGDQTSIEVIEKGDPSTRLALAAPSDGIAKV